MKLCSFLSLFLLASSVSGFILGLPKKSRALLQRSSLSYHNSEPSHNRTTPFKRKSRRSRVYLNIKKRSTYNAPIRMGRGPGPSTLKTPSKPSKRELDTRPTPQPTSPSSEKTTVHISDENDFSLIVPGEYGQKVSDAEANGISQCTVPGGSRQCNSLPQGFIQAASYQASTDGSWVQVTGCIDSTKFPGMNPGDEGGQFDVRYPNGAQCTFGGYGASFIELLEPATNRFCIRCCATENDQINCNSHMDRQGCINAIPGVYYFPEKGISCG